MKRICASSWTITKNHCMMHGQQNVEKHSPEFINWHAQTAVNLMWVKPEESFLAHYNEHKQAFRNNCHTSKFAQHLLEQAHSFSTINKTMQILHHQNKSARLSTVERYYIHAEFAANNHLNEEHLFHSDLWRHPEDPPATKAPPPWSLARSTHVSTQQSPAVSLTGIQRAYHVCDFDTSCL